jgi:hypothetical protein
MASELRAARSQGDLDPKADVKQLTFELNALLGHANAVFLLQGDRGAFKAARRGVADRLAPA